MPHNTYMYPRDIRLDVPLNTKFLSVSESTLKFDFFKNVTTLMTL